MSNTTLKLKRSAVKGKAPNTTQLELGELALNTVDGKIYLKTEDSSSTQAIHTFQEIFAGTGLTNSDGTIFINDTTVSAGSYGNASNVPVLTINAQGQVTAASTVTVAGVSSVDFDSSNGTFTIFTADGDSHSDVITLDPYSTSNLVEGTNLYYTLARVDSAFDARLATKTTDNLTEGSNLYYTQNRFNTAFLAKTTDSLSEGPLNLYYTTARVDSDIDAAFVAKSTTDLSEGSNLYYTTARVDSDIDAAFVAKSTTDLSEGDNLYYTTARVDSDIDAAFVAKSTDNLSEGSTNLYYTAARADARADVRFNVNFLAATTDSLSEGLTNLYYTTARQDSDFSVSFQAETTTNLSEGTNLYWTVARGQAMFDTRLGTKSTTDLSEGTNLYYTTARAESDARASLLVVNASGDGSLGYDSATGAITYTGPSASETRAHFSGGTGVTITDGVVAIGQDVGTTADINVRSLTATDSVQAGCIHLDKMPSAPNSLAGLLYYDSDPQSGLSFIPTTNELVQDVTINVGQETLIYVHNLTGEQINNGDAVYISGTAHGVHPQISKARANASGTSNPIGIATMDIPNGNHGYITKVGLVRGLNTSGMTEGGIAYLSADSAGKWSTTEVSIDQGYPTHVGTVIAIDSNEGSLLVNVEKEHYEYLRVEDRVIVDGSVTMDSAVATNVATNYIDFTPADPGPTQVEGRVYYNDEYKALTVYNDITGSSLQVGHEDWIRVYNNTGSPIADGTPLYITGATGETPTVAPADATTETKAQVIGIATNTIPNNSSGVATVRGLMSGIDTSSLSPGSRVHLGISGGYDAAAATYPNFPVDLGICIVQDSSNGYIYVNILEQHLESFRVTGNTHMDGNLTVDGDLTVNGTQSIVSQANLAVDNSFVYLNSGDTIGDANTNFTGSGLDDAYFTGHYEGTTTKTFYVRIDGVGTGTGGVDTFEWSFDNFSTTEATGVDITGANQTLQDGVSIFFNATTGHTSADKWDGQAAPTNVDTGWFTNRNTGATGVGYTHLGIYFDVSDTKFKVVDAYAPEPEGSIDDLDSSYSLGTFVADTFEGDLTGNVTGNVTGNATTATRLATARTIGLTGDVTATGVSFDGTGNITLTTDVASGVITNTEIASGANIADTKLATISTAGKVQNSATTATANNTAATIVARDGSGNFTAGTITASLTGTASNASQLNSQNPSYYLDHTNFTNAPSAFTKFKIGTLDTFEPDSANDILELATGPGIVFSVDSANDKLIIDTKSTTPLVTDLYTAGSGQTSYVMSKAPTSEDEMMVFVEGVYQNKNSYSIAGSTLTLADSVATGSEVVVHQVGANLVSGDVTFGQAISGTRMFSFTSASQQTVCSFDATTYRSFNLQVQVTDHVDSAYEMSQVHLIHDGTTATTTEFGTIFTGDSDLGDFDAAINGTDLDILFTPNNGNNKTIKLHFNAIKV